jgi:hypothetical protein
MQYHTLFDISTAGYKEWEFAIISGLLVAANGVVLLFFRRAKFRVSLHVVSAIVVGCPAACRTGTIPGWCGPTGTASTGMAEGRVEHYWEREWYSRLKKQTYRQEGFTVDGVRFAYSRTAEPALPNHQDPRIPLRDGMVLRVSYVADPNSTATSPCTASSNWKRNNYE